MQNTANYNLNLPEGTDVVNPLVDYNPNFTVIDGAMKANADRTVGRATCVKSGTTHVVTRSNTGSNIINFTATGDWNEGDTMTIDSTLVSVFLPDGTAALDGAYLINSEVFGILNGTRFTLYSNSVDVTNKADKSNIASVESGTTASRAYNVGELVYVSGALYRVKAAIASGSTFTVGTNIEVTNVSDEVTNVSDEVKSFRKNTLGNSVELTVGVNYFAPSDGYFKVETSNQSGNYAYGYVNGILLLSASSLASQLPMQAHPITSIFVRKGAILSYAHGGIGTGTFYPLQ